MEPVRSHRNPRVVEAARLHRVRERRATGKTILEGPGLLAEALAAGVEPDAVFALPEDEVTAKLARDHGFVLTLVESTALGRVTGTARPRGPAAVIAVPAPTPPTGRDMIVAWGLSDPGNVGTLIRTAAAFGWEFGYTMGTADPWAPKVLRAGAGGHFRVAVTPVESLQTLEGAGLATVAMVVRGGVSPDALGSGSHALLVGEEAPGLPPDVIEQSAHKVSIPMPGGMESLNAAMAAGIVIYELSKYQIPNTRYGERQRPL
ncbi:MAG TPA: RNA methyltransferase [Acidimicrobiia bacterium]|nr:RNA methyltransferase [Acidimicrobiia bacterium]